MKTRCLAAAALVAGTSRAQMPLFAARCPSGITAGCDTKGQVDVNGQVAKLVDRPDGQITAPSAGGCVDITPRGSEAPIVTATAKDQSVGRCAIVSFMPPHKR